MIVQVNHIHTDRPGLMGCPECNSADEYRDAMRAAYRGKWGQAMVSATYQESLQVRGRWANEAAEILRRLGANRIEVTGEAA